MGVESSLVPIQAGRGKSCRRQLRETVKKTYFSSLTTGHCLREVWTIGSSYMRSKIPRQGGTYGYYHGLAIANLCHSFESHLANLTGKFLLMDDGWYTSPTNREDGRCTCKAFRPPVRNC